MGAAMTYNRETEQFRTFGRTKGRALTPTQKDMMDRIYPKVVWDSEKDGAKDRPRPLWLEVGFGGGEHLAHQAKTNPDVEILGAEPFLNGVAKAVKHIDDNDLENVRLYQGDVRTVLNDLNENSLDRAFVLFPDPWTKTRHHKRRLINEEFLGSLHRALKPGAELRFASDIIHYVDWTLTRVHKMGGFDWPVRRVSDWRVPPHDWCPTRYEAKAKREGRECHYFRFVKRK